jgi:Ser/Thr protein kinase RdoA (MazF antagonist)
VKQNSIQSFTDLNPDKILSAVEAAGFWPTGEFQQLNSYENRVFEVKLEASDNPETPQKIIVKFYRPGRWSLPCIQEEHSFLIELEAEKIPVVAPIRFKQNSTILEFEGHLVAFFPKFYGKMPDEFLGDDLQKAGRTLAQIHNVGAKYKFKHRPRLGFEPYQINEMLHTIDRFLVPEMKSRYLNAAQEIEDLYYDNFDSSRFFRIHGDCHRGNLLKRPQTGTENLFYFIDFDDCMMGPASQDVWMLLSDFSDESEKEILLSGYEELRDFPLGEWQKIPILRGLRIISYAAWIGNRWLDPSFPKIFPEFGSYNYWAEETEQLEKILRLF